MSDSQPASRESQTAPAVLMVRPAHFAANPETASSNFFQREALGPADLTDRARREFDALALALADAGVRVHEFSGLGDIALPDEVFPNNWLSLHADGTAVLYPMLAMNRRRERRPELLETLRDRLGYRLERILDLTAFETRGEYLEGTGSLVLDRGRRMAYACLSPRTHAAPLAEFQRALGYGVVPFHAADRAGRPIYHTNVLLSIGTRFAALCTQAIAMAERRLVIERLTSTGREVVELTFAQLESFAGNMLELHGRDGPVIALSKTALGSLGAPGRRRLERHAGLVAADVPTIEHVGGGSVRCMLAEVALPRA
jgi:hypothetical protein